VTEVRPAVTTGGALPAWHRFSRAGGPQGRTSSLRRLRSGRSTLTPARTPDNPRAYHHRHRTLHPATRPPLPAAGRRQKKQTGKEMTDAHPEYADRIYAHNLDQATTPAGLKVRWKIRIATGAEAKRLDQLQQQAIMNLLTWADKHYQQQPENPRTAPEIP
jgi:hypothetical protein